MAGKSSKTPADAAVTTADPVATQEGEQTEGSVTQQDTSTETITTPAAEIVPPPPAPAAATPEPSAAEFVAGELTAPPVMLHPDALNQLVELLAARLAPAVAPMPAADEAPAPVASPAPVEMVQPTPPSVTCRALRPIEHDGVRYGPQEAAGDEFVIAAGAAAPLKAIGAIELV